MNSKVKKTLLSKKYPAQLLEDIKKHHTVYNTPIDGIYFEELVNNAFLKFDIETGWDPLNKSHQQGVDVAGLSLKTTRLKSGKFAITSFRTTSYESLDDKAEYIKKINETIDGYLVCVKSFSTKTRVIDYLIYYFEHGIEFMDLDSYSWRGNYSKSIETEGKLTGFIGDHPTKSVKATITFSMSHQLIFKDISLKDLEKDKLAHLICKHSHSLG